MIQTAEKRWRPPPGPGRGVQWEDPLDLEGELAEEERMVQAIPRVVMPQDRLFPQIIKVYREETFDRAIIGEMGALGLLGPTIPAEYGGAGLGYVSAGLITRELERVDSGFRSAMSVQSSLVMYPIFAYGTEAQRRKFLPKLANGELVGCFGLTEPDHGSDPGSMVTRAEKAPGEIRLTGAKTLTKCADCRCRDRVGQARRRHSRLHPRTRHGRRGDAEDRGQAVAARVDHRELVLDGAFVPADNLLPNAKGLAGPFGCLNGARYGIAWGAMGAAEFCWHRARQYTLDRKQFGRPLAANQLVQKKLADMQTEITLGLHAVRARPAAGSRQGGAAGDLDAQAQQLRQGPGHRAARPRHAWRQRHRGRVPRHARAVQPGNRQHLRGHARHSCVDPWPRADRDPGVLLVPEISGQ